MAVKNEVILKINGDPILGVTEGNDRGLTESAIYVTNQAKVIAPVDLGAGRNSIMYKLANGENDGFNNSTGESAPAKLTSTPKAGSAFVGSNLLYMTYQEFGTRFMQPQPWLRPSGESLTIDIPAEQSKEAMSKALKKGVKIIKIGRP